MRFRVNGIDVVASEVVEHVGHFSGTDGFPGRPADGDRLGPVEHARRRLAVVIQAILEMPHVADHRGAVAVGAAVALGSKRATVGTWPGEVSRVTRISPGSLSLNSAWRLPFVPKMPNWYIGIGGWTTP